MTIYAQNNAEGCKDHPMFNRMSNYLILECSNNYGLADNTKEEGKAVNQRVEIVKR